MRKIRFFLLIITLMSMLFYSVPTYACSCFGASENFFETIARENKERASAKSTSNLIIITGLVKEAVLVDHQSKPVKISIEVFDIIQGDVASKRLTIGSSPIGCSVGPNGFKIGKKYVFALERNGPEYFVPSCGKYYKEVSSQNAH